MNAPLGVDWTSALLVLAAGLVLGTILVWRVLGRARAEATSPVAAPGEQDLLRRDLEGKRTALLHQLRELEDTGSRRTPEQLARERYALELEAAGVLLALDDLGPVTGRASSIAPGGAPAASAAGTTAESFPAGGVPNAPVVAPASGTRGFLWGMLSTGALGLLLFFLYTQARPRPEGGSVTGDIGVPRAADSPAMGGAAGAPGGGEVPTAEETQLRERVAQNPDDLGARMDLARSALVRQDMMAVWNETKAVLERSPGHPQAMAYQALVRLAMGQGDKAEELLKQALAKDPDLIDGYVHLALVYARLGRMGDAEKTIGDASKRFPDQAASLQRLLADLARGDARADADAVTGGAMLGGGPASGDPHADPHAGIDLAAGGVRPAAGAMAVPGGTAPPAPPGGGKRITGLVDLDPALAGQVAASGVLFVFVREAGFGAGPPVAARRFPVTAFPVAFEIGEADAMMGQSFPDALLVEARLDADGDPTTRPPTDPKARLDDVKTGSKDVKLVLKRAS